MQCSKLTSIKLKLMLIIMMHKETHTVRSNLLWVVHFVSCDVSATALATKINYNSSAVKSSFRVNVQYG